ncbi:MAG: immunity 17 family protein [Tannerellaceae bacterium]|jgi:hypothetical protein|nr:immunity 17 family protein [Tannerellaceae bacterium]
MKGADYVMVGVLLGLGLLSVCAGVFNIRWFLETGSAQFVVRRLGEKGGRAFYVVVGAGMIGMGVWVSMGG